jgi:hypothetical protein
MEGVKKKGNEAYILPSLKPQADTASQLIIPVHILQNSGKKYLKTLTKCFCPFLGL